MTFLWSIASFIVAIGVLVTVHEFGHFWVARRLGVKVLRFSIGFGRPLWRSQAGPDATEYVIAAIPLGGYVKMLDEAEGEVAEHERDRAFNRQPLSTRIAVVVAGPAFNFLFAVFAYWIMYMVGVTGLKPIVGGVDPGSLAAAAGLRAGHEIVAVEGRATRSWDRVVQHLTSAALDRGGVRITVEDPPGVSRTLRMSLETLVVDELTRGQFFEAIGFSPARPVVPARIDSVEPGRPAETAGLRAGDLVVSADGVPIRDWGHWVEFVQAHPAATIAVEVERAGATVTLEMTPESVSREGGTVGQIGARAQAPEAAYERLRSSERYGPLAALNRALARTWDVSLLTVRFLWKMVTLEISAESLSGPISIAQYAGISAQVGIARFLEFLGIVSISLGILNLLPIPLLDGGHLLYYCIELIQRRPVSEEVQFVGQRLGIAMLVGLMGLAFYNDLARLFG